MKIRKSLAGVAAGSLALTGIAVAAAPAAQAASYPGVFSGINNVGLQAPVSAGTKTVNVTVSGGATVGAPLTVSVTSPDLAFVNGPAATVAAGGSRIDAVISINSVDYLIKGPSNTGSIAPNGTIVAAGWTVSSADGADSTTGTTNNNGVDIINSSGAVTSSNVAFTAPGNAGTYSVVLKALINNSITGTGTGGIDYTEPDPVGAPGVFVNAFDQIWGIGSTVAPYSGTNTASQFGAVGSLAVAGPAASVTSSTGQNANTPAIRLNLPAFTGYSGGPTVVGLAGSVWGSNVAAGGFTVQFCNTAGASCNTPNPSNWVITNTIATGPTGDLLAGSQVSINRVNFDAGPPGITAGSRTIKLTQGANTALVPVFILGTPTITVTPANGGPGTIASVSGSNFNPGQAVSLTGRTGAASPFGNNGGSSGTATTDTGTVAAANVNSTGSFVSGSITINDPLTNALGGEQGSAPFNLSQGSVGGYVAFTVNKDRCTKVSAGSIDPVTGEPVAGTTNATCNTEQNVNAKIVPGELKQQAFATGSLNPNATTVLLDADPATAGQQALQVPLADTDVNGVLNSITVTDQRGGTTGWSLTSKFSGNFKSTGNDTIASSRFSISNLSCNGIAGSAPSVPGAGGAYLDDPATGTDESTVTLCNTTTNAVNATSQSTSGQWAVGGDVKLNVPAFQKAGNYTATLVVTLA